MKVASSCFTFQYLLRSIQMNLLPELNFDNIDIPVKWIEEKPHVFDIVRKKNISLTPEEWVRQHFIHFLIRNGYPKSLMLVERSHQLAKLKKRVDILVVDRETNPFLVVECKSPSQKIDTSTLKQASIYNYSHKAKYVALSNGTVHYYLEYSEKENTLSLLKSLPAYL